MRHTNYVSRQQCAPPPSLVAHYATYQLRQPRLTSKRQLRQFDHSISQNIIGTYLNMFNLISVLSLSLICFRFVPGTGIWYPLNNKIETNKVIKIKKRCVKSEKRRKKKTRAIFSPFKRHHRSWIETTHIFTGFLSEKKEEKREKKIGEKKR